MERHNAANPDKPMRFDEAFFTEMGREDNADLAAQLRQDLTVPMVRPRTRR